VTKTIDESKRVGHRKRRRRKKISSSKSLLIEVDGRPIKKIGQRDKEKIKKGTVDQMPLASLNGGLLSRVKRRKVSTG